MTREKVKSFIDKGVGNTQTALKRMPEGVDQASFLKGYHQCHMQLWDYLANIADGPITDSAHWPDPNQLPLAVR